MQGQSMNSTWPYNNRSFPMPNINVVLTFNSCTKCEGSLGIKHDHTTIGPYYSKYKWTVKRTHQFFWRRKSDYQRKMKVSDWPFYFIIPHVKILSRDWLTKVGHSIMSTGEMFSNRSHWWRLAGNVWVISQLWPLPCTQSSRRSFPHYQRIYRQSLLFSLIFYEIVVCSV